MFLRHLRRTSALLHVVDAAAADPATDYLAVGLPWEGDLSVKGWIDYLIISGLCPAPFTDIDPPFTFLCAQVREELRMYNPEYCCRPHVVALNKMDLEVGVKQMWTCRA